MLAGRRADLARAITLVESTNPQHRVRAQELLLAMTPHAGKSFRVGITGVPGVGKSTTIETLGMYLISQGHRVAVLAVDPSSTRTGGSILGDKTRMGRLAAHPDAYIRPSPTAGTLGGVAKATRETIVLVEAAGYDVVLVETVGVGQSEVTVANMVDTFTFLTLARTGDSLQGIKKGVLELADVVVVNKADGKHIMEARAAARELRGALGLIYPHDAFWTPPVLTMSALEDTGVDEYWAAVQRHREAMVADGRFDSHRSRQQVDWMWTMVHDALLARLDADPAVDAVRADVEARIDAGELTPALGAAEGTNSLMPVVPMFSAADRTPFRFDGSKGFVSRPSKRSSATFASSTFSNALDIKTNGSRAISGSSLAAFLMSKAERPGKPTSISTTSGRKREICWRHSTPSDTVWIS